MQRTIRLQLLPTIEQESALRETLSLYASCYNAVTSYGWANSETNGVSLHHATYYSLRERFPQLPSQLVCAARVNATESLKSACTLKQKGEKVSCPTVSRATIRYDARSYRMDLAKQSVSLSSVSGRQTVPFAIHPHAKKHISKATGFDSADVFERDGKFWIHAVVTIPAPAVVLSSEVVGVDFGICRPAVASNNRFFGEKRWREVEQRYFRLKRKLQTKGTKSAHRHLRVLKHRLTRFRTDCDHVLSKRIVQSVAPGTTIVIENLTNIRKNTKQNGKAQRRRMHSWPFRRLAVFLTYKAEDAGDRVEGIDPRKTSQRDSRCGYTHRSNRRSQSVFKCRKCGFELNADLNASRNIRWKYLDGVGISDSAGLPSNSLTSCS